MSHKLWTPIFLFSGVARLKLENGREFRDYMEAQVAAIVIFKTTLEKELERYIGPEEAAEIWVRKYAGEFRKNYLK